MGTLILMKTAAAVTTTITTKTTGYLPDIVKANPVLEHRRVQYYSMQGKNVFSLTSNNIIILTLLCF